MQKKNEAPVEPGIPLAYSEEFLPGSGTYDDGEQIRAALFGFQKVDPETMTLSVEPAGRDVALIEAGDVVVGEITYMKPDLASVKIVAVRGKEGRSILQNVEGTLHVSKVDKRYIDDIASEFRCGDLIRARVVGLKGGPQLATDRGDLGVVRAFSRDNLRRSLVREGDRLVDPETGVSVRRKMADDYGRGTV